MSNQTTKTGTREWSDKSYNIQVGCSHGCLYCYARANALRFKRIKSPEDWLLERPLPKRPVPRNAGTVMFPTTHDITPANLDAATQAIAELLRAGNNVLIVSKPHIECISYLCGRFRHETNIMFRFSMGSMIEKLAKFWEPGAPSPLERFTCLQRAHLDGFATSVSMEPFLAGTGDAIDTFDLVAPYVTDKVWIGRMNQVRARVPQTTDEPRNACNRILEIQSDEALRPLIRELKGHPKVAWKDSLKHLVEGWKELPK